MLQAILVGLAVLCLVFSLAVSAYITLFKLNARNLTGMVLFILLTTILWVGTVSVAVAGVMVHP